MEPNYLAKKRRRARAEKAKGMECSFNYEELMEHSLKIWILMGSLGRNI